MESKSQSEAFAIEIDVKFDEYCQISNEAADCKCGDICKLYGLCKGSYLAGAKFGSEQATSRIRGLEVRLQEAIEIIKGCATVDRTDVCSKFLSSVAKVKEDKNAGSIE